MIGFSCTIHSAWGELGGRDRLPACLPSASTQEHRAATPPYPSSRSNLNVEGHRGKRGKREVPRLEREGNNMVSGMSEASPVGRMGGAVG